MKINRNNYEAFLLDLSEGNLSEELRSELNSFLASNPDLDVELIDDFSIIEDQNNKTIDKDLLKFDTINESNRKYFFIAYHEGDLNASEKEDVLRFISKNSKMKQEFDQFSSLYLKSTNEVFKDKKSLHSIAHNYSSRGFIYWSVRIAAILLIGFILNSLLQNTSSIEPRYTLVEDDLLNLTPSIQHAENVEITETKVKEDIEKSNNINTLAVYNQTENISSDKENTNTKDFETKKGQENVSHDFDKREPKIQKRNPDLDIVIASLNQNSNNEESETIESLPIKNIKTPPSLLAYLGEKAKEKEILSENGRPNIVSLLNKGSKSLTGDEILATSQTEQSSSTIFQLGSLKIERIRKK